MWRRYWRAAAWAVPTGAAIGIAIYLAIYLTGNSAYRTYGGWGAFFHALAGGCVIGAVTALAGVVGGALSLVIWDRKLLRSAGSRKAVGSIGAAGGAALFWLCVGLVSALVSPTDWSWFGVTGIFMAVAAPITWIAADTLIGRAEERAERDGVEFRFNV
ncbi:hypothetical protein [Cryobacterium sp. BB307]|uniref:hypothetical protein n=1 Tax=Cryobacterium sp. BB307 TaxID=2716317 RepID=UPI0014454E8F|nr:hypothetical protein [Cryobacterium sp. BB307]